MQRNQTVHQTSKRHNIDHQLIHIWDIHKKKKWEKRGDPLQIFTPTLKVLNKNVSGTIVQQ